MTIEKPDYADNQLRWFRGGLIDQLIDAVNALTKISEARGNDVSIWRMEQKTLSQNVATNDTEIGNLIEKINALTDKQDGFETVVNAWRVAVEEQYDVLDKRLDATREWVIAIGGRETPGLIPLTERVENNRQRLKCLDGGGIIGEKFEMGETTILSHRIDTLTERMNQLEKWRQDPSAMEPVLDNAELPDGLRWTNEGTSTDYGKKYECICCHCGEDHGRAINSRSTSDVCALCGKQTVVWIPIHTQTEYKRQEDEIDKLKAELASAGKPDGWVRWYHKAKKMERSNSKLSNLNTELKAENARLKKEHDNDFAILKETEKMQGDEIHRLEAKKKELKADVDRWVRKAMTYEDQVRELKAENEKWREENDAFEHEVDELNEGIDALMAERKRCKEMERRLRNQKDVWGRSVIIDAKEKEVIIRNFDYILAALSDE